MDTQDILKKVRKIEIKLAGSAIIYLPGNIILPLKGVVWPLVRCVIISMVMIYVI